MEASRSLRGTINRSMIIIAVLSVGMAASLWIFQEYVRSSGELSKQKDAYIAAKRTDLKTEVDRAVAFIEYKRTTTEQHLKDSIRNRVYEAHGIAAGIYEAYRGLKSDLEIQESIKEALRPLVFNNGRGYFFIYDMQGNSVLLPFSPHLEGKNLWNFKDGKGDYGIQKTAKMIREKGEGFQRWYWYKPGDNEQLYEKIGFSKRFEPYNWWIGTGEYIEDFSRDVRQETLGWINTIRFGQDGYIFVYAFDGTILAHFMQETIGDNVLQDTTDPYGIRVVGELIRISQQEGGGFLEYEGKIRPSTGLRAQKIGYSRSVKDWQWTVGAGVYVDAINDVIATERKKLIEKIIGNILVSFLIFAVSLVIIGLFLKSISQKTAEHIAVFTRFFKQASTQLIKISDDAVRFSEFGLLACSANQMVDDRIKAENALRISEERLNLALSATNQGIWDWNLGTDEFHFDERYYRMAGYEPHEFPEAFEEWEKRVHPEDLERTKSAVGQYLSGEIPYFDIELRFLRKDGDYMWVRGKGKIVARDDQGNPARFVGTHADITSSKQTEEELRRLRNYLSNIIDSMPSVLVGVDSDGKVTQWNRQAEQETGLSVLEVQSQPLAKVFPRLVGQMDRIQTSIRDRRVLKDLKTPHKHQDEIRYEDVTIFPLVTNGVEGAVIRIDDVTERVRMEEMMIQSEKMLSVGGLAAGMAHEVNNPLAGILQNASVLENRLIGDLPANRKAAETAGITMAAIRHYLKLRKLPDMLENIRVSGSRATAIVKNMLSFARKSENILSSHDLGSLLDQTVDLLKTDYDMKKKYDFKQIQIKREYDRSVGTVLCEASKIQQVFMNVLKNGAEAMAEVQVAPFQPMFVLRIQDEDSWVRVEIEDNGPGMDEKTRRQIFEPFFTTKPVGKGTGLGLSVSYFIVTKDHGGSMSVQAADGGGTRFVIRLLKAGIKLDSDI